MCKSLKWTLVLTLLALILISCVAPFSDLQSAATLGKDHLEVTPAYSYVGYRDDGSGDHVQSHLAVLAGVGLHDRFDIRLRFDGISIFDEDKLDYWVLSAGPKVSIIPKRLSFFLPFGILLEDLESLETHPIILLSIPATRRIDLHSSLKYLIPVIRDNDPVWGINFGLSVAVGRRGAIRPETGFLFHPDESSRYYHYSLGCSFNPSARE